VVKSGKKGAGQVARLEQRIAYTVLVANSEGKGQPGRHAFRWENSVIMELLEIG